MIFIINMVVCIPVWMWLKLMFDWKSRLRCFFFRAKGSDIRAVTNFHPVYTLSLIFKPHFKYFLSIMASVMNADLGKPPNVLCSLISDASEALKQDCRPSIRLLYAVDCDGSFPFANALTILMPSNSLSSTQAWTESNNN